jgi:membrane dipeptidase
MRSLLCVAVLFLTGLSVLGQRFASEAELDAKARAIHGRLIAIDTHTDVLLPETNNYYYLPGRQSRTDVEKLKRGGMGAVAIAIAVHQTARAPEGYAAAKKEAEEKLAIIRKLLADNPGSVELARTAADIERIRKAGKVAVIESFVNAYSIGTDIGKIDELYKEGVRLFGLVHGDNNDWADSSRAPDGKSEHNGLSDLGKQAIGKLNGLGMIVDVSQMSDVATLQTIKLSKAPVVASHSSVRSIVDKPRNLSDAELDAIKTNGGVVGITVWNGYVANVHTLPPDILSKLRAIREKYGFPAEFPGTDFAYGIEGHLPQGPYYDFYGESVAVYPKANIKDVVDHIDYIAKRIGVEHVGIGSDFNHGSGVEGFNDESEAPNITKELLRRGYTEKQIAKIWGGNFLRVWRQVEKVSKELKRK